MNTDAPERDRQDMQHEATDSINAALKLMRENRPLRAEEICRDHLLMNPGSVEHLRLLGHALIRQKRFSEAEEQLRFALSIKPDFPQLHEDMGNLLMMQEKFEDAIARFETAIKLEPRLPLAHKKLGEALAALGRDEEADDQFEQFFEQDPDAGDVAVAMNHMRSGRRDDAVDRLTAVLKRNPNNVDAMRALAVTYWQEDRNLQDAEAWLRRAVNYAPDFLAAWLTLGPVLMDMAKFSEAIDCFKDALKVDSDNPIAWAGLASAYSQAGHSEKALEAYETATSKGADSAGLHMSHAHVLKTVGDQPGAVNAYRAAIRQKPEFGEAYWSMANLKVFRFEDEEVAAMEGQLAKGKLSDSAEVHFRFALGKACEDKEDYEKAWHYYHTGNRKQRPLVAHDPASMEHRHDTIKSIFDEAFLERHGGNGLEDAAPILIVGLPRSGSTLVEQILASHSQVEGTSELPVLSKMAGSIGRYRPDGVQFPEAIRDLRRRDWKAYGQQYIERTQAYRQTNLPFFTDKLPNNFPLVGLLHLILPNAKIINTRRHPLDSCLGAYKQLFARGQNFTYDIEDLSHYYLNYIGVMKHWHSVLPGKVLDVHYEDTVTDLDGQVRRILDHCGLPFEESCLRFHETARSVRTASSEQVRQPIFTSALGKWKRYDRHLGTWKQDFQEIVAALPGSVRKAAG